MGPLGRLHSETIRARVTPTPSLVHQPCAPSSFTQLSSVGALPVRSSAQHICRWPSLSLEGALSAVSSS